MAFKDVILLAEADAKLAPVMDVALHHLDMPYRLVRVTNGHEAIRYLQGEGQYARRDEFPLPRLVLLDLGIKRLDAVSVLRWIRKSAPVRHLAVVVLGKSVFDSKIAVAYAEGANTFLVKSYGYPAILDQLREIGEQWLGKGTKQPRLA